MPVSILEKICGHQDLVELNDLQREQLCEEIRAFLVSHIAMTGGHLASNLGVVELSVAIETVFNTSEDRLVFDVGHQSYVHKLLTGRRADFDRLRQFGGMAGFPKPSESVTDAFVAGHASSSVSIALGMARARTLQNEKYNVIALLGDGAATGGMVYEGLNDAAVSREPMIVILNDNEMSIDRNVGGMASHLSVLRTKDSYLGMKRKYRTVLERIPGGSYLYRITRKIKDRLRRALIPTTIFENMGMTYLGPVDGHDVNNMISLLRTARDLRRPVLLHVITQKGRGYAPAVKEPSKFHGVGKFDPVTGEVPAKSLATFSEAFGETMCALAQQNDKVCALTAAMPSGTGLLRFQEQFPKRLFDVGIAEEHAVSMAGGLAKQGMIPVVALYSTFLQRSFDMILQDITMLNLHVVLAVDRAGLVGEDGETHHGIFDVGFLRQAPGMQILCPASTAELRGMLNWAVNQQNGPVAIRYPRGGNGNYIASRWSGADDVLQCHRRGNDVVLLTYGTLINNVLDAASILSENGIEATVFRLLSVSDIPVKQLAKEIPAGTPVVVLEEVCSQSGVCDRISYELQQYRVDCRVYGRNLGDSYVTHGDMKSLYQHYKLDAMGISDYTQEVVRGEN